METFYTRASPQGTQRYTEEKRPRIYTDAHGSAKDFIETPREPLTAKIAKKVRKGRREKAIAST
jgi:hypothetical protein